MLDWLKLIPEESNSLLIQVTFVMSAIFVGVMIVPKDFIETFNIIRVAWSESKVELSFEDVLRLTSTLSLVSILIKLGTNGIIFNRLTILFRMIELSEICLVYLVLILARIQQQELAIWDYALQWHKGLLFLLGNYPFTLLGLLSLVLFHKDYIAYSLLPSSETKPRFSLKIRRGITLVTKRTAKQ